MKQEQQDVAAHSLYSVSPLRHEFHLLGIEFPCKSIYGFSKNNLSLLNTTLFSYMAKNVSGLIQFYFRAPLNRTFWILTRTVGRTEFYSLEDDVPRLGQVWVPPLTGRGKQDVMGQLLEERHWKTRDQLASEKGSSWAIMAVPLTAPSTAATKDIPVLFNKGVSGKFCEGCYPKYLWKITLLLNI